MGIIVAFITLVITRYPLHYFILIATNSFAGMSSTEISNTFNEFQISSTLPIIYTVIFIFILISLGILFDGIKDDIEKYSKVLMPGLVEIIVLLFICTITLPSTTELIEFLLKPNFSELSMPARL